MLLHTSARHLRSRAWPTSGGPRAEDEGEEDKEAQANAFTMQSFTVVAYVIALGVIVLRISLTGKRTIDVWARQRGQTLFWPFAPLVDGLFWSRLFQMATDMTLSLAGMVLTRAAIAGTASAPIGALLGLSCSLMITSGGWYFKKQTAARGTPSQS